MTAFTNALADYQKTVKTRRAIKHTHKKNFVSVNHSVCIKSLWLDHEQAHDLQLGKKNNIDVVKHRIQRQVDTRPSTRIRTVLVDYGNEHLITADDNYLVVPADHSWHVVQQYENAIFVDEHGMWYAYLLRPQDNYIYLTLDDIQLVVLREVGSSRLEALSYISSIVKEAANDRKTVRVSCLV